MLPSLRIVQVKVPSVWPLTGLVAVVLSMPRTGVNSSTSVGEQAAAARRLPHEGHRNGPGCAGDDAAWTSPSFMWGSSFSSGPGPDPLRFLHPGGP